MRILIAEDNEPFRLALRKMIEAQEGWTVCGEAANGAEAIEQAQRLKPDLIVLDYAMPRGNGLEAAHKISELLPGVPIILNTLYEREIVDVEAMKHGVSCVNQKSEAGVLIATIKSYEESLRVPKMAPPSPLSVKTEPGDGTSDKKPPPRQGSSQ